MQLSLPASTRSLVLGAGAAAAAALVVSYALKPRRRPTPQPETPAPKMPEARTVVEALALRAEGPNKHKAALQPVGAPAVTWAQYFEHVQGFSRALRAVGMPEVGAGPGPLPGVAVHAFNCPEWFYAALGAMLGRWTVSGIYNTNTYDQAAHILRTSDVRVLIIQDAEMYHATYEQQLHADFPEVLAVVIADPAGSLPARREVMTYAAFVATGVGEATPAVRELRDDDVASLVYTSGTTGNPKAVVCTHANLRVVVAMAHGMVPLNEKTRVISYLPLSHIAAQAIDLYQALYSGSLVVFATKDALKGALKQTLVDTKPTLFFGVPRVYEKMRAGMLKAAAEKYSKPGIGPVLKAIGDVAKWTATMWHSAGAADGPGEWVRVPLAPLYYLSKALVYSKVKKAMGLERCGLLYTGAAPLRQDTQRYFRSLDMPLLEVYGMSESTGCMACSSVNDPPRPMGSCGRALPGCEIVIADDGEICCRGGNVMPGYLKNEDASAEMVDASGLLHTGDVGRVDEDGWLFITGRKKELLITDGGENVAPVPIEDAILKATEAQGLSEEVGHVMLIGDQRKCLMCLFALSEDADPALRGDRTIAQKLTRAIEAYNTLHAKSRAQKVQNFAVVDAFIVPTGELTPTMKMKRGFIERKYAEVIDGLYMSAAA
eukprot:CAMPEP_0118862318 /NCGR_PEP_ID=MMETSP1163-20130328/7555_1 /TAXON_ID=124430 /ORGANISM="Phaeomonas parva, Strain CCMP2877" /LENGTH=658 /DNA_ID=CAMNT_0006796209 /DNA_START=112 /DNA_END=2088 /DNA_ORIENTATION=+